MKSTKTAIMTIAITLAVIAGMTGFAAAMNTNVVYSGDGQYNCNYNAEGTGYIGIHTYTNDGTDHLMSGWANSCASGWQKMDTYIGNEFGTDYSGTVITRSATVGGAAVGEDEAGFIKTVTKDDNGNRIISYANYHDNHGYGSHVTTGQTAVVGSLVDIMGSSYTVTGVVAVTTIDGVSYGSDTVVSGLVRTWSGDEYTYVVIKMDDGKMYLYTLSATGSVDPTYTTSYILQGTTISGACGQLVYAGAEGDGVFGAGSGTDMHGASFWMEENGVDNIEVWTDASGPTMYMTTTFNGDFEANGYVYAVDLP